MAERGKSEYSQSVTNALRLLGCFVERESAASRSSRANWGSPSPPWPASWPRSRMGGCSCRTRKRGNTASGTGFLLYGSLVRERNELSRALAPALAQLAEKYQSTAHLAVLDDGELTIVNKVSAGPFVYMSSRVGGTLPIHASATGKCILAWLPPERRRELIESAELRRYTATTITDPDALETELAAIRERGYALDDRGDPRGPFLRGLSGARCLRTCRRRGVRQRQPRPRSSRVSARWSSA